MHQNLIIIIAVIQHKTGIKTLQAVTTTVAKSHQLKSKNQ